MCNNVFRKCGCVSPQIQIQNKQKSWCQLFCSAISKFRLRVMQNVLRNKKTFRRYKNVYHSQYQRLQIGRVGSQCVIKVMTNWGKRWGIPLIWLTMHCLKTWSFLVLHVISLFASIVVSYSVCTDWIGAHTASGQSKETCIKLKLKASSAKRRQNYIFLINFKCFYCFLKVHCWSLMCYINTIL